MKFLASIYKLSFTLLTFCLILSFCTSPEDTLGSEEEEDAKEEIEEKMEEEQDSNIDTEVELTFLALGDSYTIGESVAESERWPVQLVKEAKTEGYQVLDPKIIARTGWTTDELKAAIIDEKLGDSTFNFVSLLIGVNNQFRGYPFSQYETEFVELLETAISFAGGDTSNVFVVSIPDYGVTPFGASYNPEKIARELDQYNSYAESICKEKGVEYFYITEISRRAETEADLIASDKLHPSGKMYKLWVEEITPWFIEKLN